MMNLTENFTMDEMIKTNKPFANIPNMFQTLSICLLVFYFLQPLRNLLKKAITITCGFRCEKVNIACGGTEKSQHLKGQAVDINVNGMKKADLFQFIVTSGLSFDQLIYEVDSNCLHVSYISKKENRKQILIRKIVNNEKKYFEYTPENVKSMVLV